MPLGMCEPGPPGAAVGGSTTMLVIPVKVPAPTLAAWHELQLVMPAWFIAEPENFAPFCTGVTATLDLAPTWQLSHACPPTVGMWPDAGRPTSLKPIAGSEYMAAFAALWHWAQSPVWLGA